MNLTKVFILCLISVFIYSCSDNKEDIVLPEDTPNLEAEKQIEEVIEVINNDKELSSFKEALAKLDAKKFVEKEFTILAYKNKQEAQAVSANARISSANTNSKDSQQDNETLRHVIGGHHSFDALKKLNHIVALSKDTLYIKYSEAENAISINGVLLGKSMSAGKSIIFVTDSIIPQAKDTTVIKDKEYLFRVININTSWSPENASEGTNFVENANITIYQDDKIIKELKTDQGGVARFTYREDNNLDYIIKTDTSSMLYKGYLVKGLFTSQEQLDAAPVQKEFKAVMGGLRLADVNGDNLVDSNDTMDRYELNNLSDDQPIFLVGESYTFPKDEPEVEDITIDMAYDAYDDVEEFFARVDNSYSTLASRQSLSPTSKLVDSLWHNSYEAIRKINIVMDYSTTTKEDRQELEGFRANLFLNLSSVFGGIPLQLSHQEENLPRTNILSVYKFVLTSYQKAFDSTSDSIKYKSDEFINSILVNRLQKKHSEVYNLAQQAISSGTISLHSNFANSELYAIRLYLFLAESSNELGNRTVAIESMNTLLNAEGNPSLGMDTTTEKLRTIIREFYNKSTFYHNRIDEGMRYKNIESWSLNGTWGKYQLLPIPQNALTKFGNETLLTQNPSW